MHANFSNGAMRDQGGEELFKKICEEFGKNIDRHISVYGADNNQRLTGLQMKLSQLINSATASPIVEHPYESQLERYRTVGKVALKIDAQLLTVIRIRLQLLSSRQLKKLYRNFI